MPRMLLLSLIALLVFPSVAAARGGNYSFVGGNRQERSQVTKALAVSSFNWSLIGSPVQVIISRGGPGDSYSTPGKVTLDAGLLDSGSFAWGVVQHEFAHQVDFALLSDSDRQQLLGPLGGVSWFGTPGQVLTHAQYGCERFASMLAWAYWPVAANIMKPRNRQDEAGSMSIAAFKLQLGQILAAHAS